MKRHTQLAIPAILLIAGLPLHAETTSKIIFKATAAPEASDTHAVVLDVDYDLPIYQELSGLFALEATGTDTGLYYGLSEEEGDHVYTFNLPDGDYDFYVGVILGEYEGTAVLTLDDVHVDSDMSLSLQVSSAIHRTDIMHIAPDGSELHMQYGYPGGSVPHAQLNASVSHLGNLIYTQGHSTDTEGMTYFLCNNPESRFNITRLDLMMSPFGFLNMIIPVDFSKEVASTDTENWMTAEETFTETPANARLREFYASQGQPDYHYVFSPCFMIYNGRLNGFGGLGTFDPACESNRVSVWQPAGYDGAHEIWPVPTGASLTGWGADVAGLPLRRTADGFRQAGLNVLPNRQIFMCYDSPSPGPEYDAFALPVPEIPLGNCAPMLVFYPEEEYYDFTYTGRHGESMSQSSGYYTLPDPGYWDNIFGSRLCDLKLYGDQTLVCDSRYDFPYDIYWQDNKNYRIEIFTDNVLVDGSVPGFNRTEATMRSANLENSMPPTLTSLRVLDADGNLNDRLPLPEECTVAFTAGHFSYGSNYVEMYEFAECEDVECVSVEFAPRGTDDFKPLDVTQEGETIRPGYGTPFIAALDKVDVESADGWYDLRISIKDAYEGTQTQTISPAFHLEGLSGINSVTSASTADDEEYFTLQGIRCKDMSAPGIYIVRKADGRTRMVSK